ncbi:hypothetical protein FXN63_10925 [Pigmentiphaga aceris]|uniref:Uncharacterized protein n=1 Tax=Pigmentiphaga aceris TaxID=1940612 RepID=A0A5C0AWY7_9BURK|nr:Imm10 family immunity protein [Pigmentiphaga aceris]QEI06286.1 hypothetical protein FXN63_10925 [Pigmentiphaga aceris]
MTLHFPAQVYTAYTEDEVLTVALADSTDPDPACYLILQRSQEDDEQDAELGMDTYHATLGGQALGGQALAGYGGIDAVQIAPDRLTFHFSTTTPWCQEVGILIIDLHPGLGAITDMAQALQAVFADRPTVLSHG